MQFASNTSRHSDVVERPPCPTCITPMWLARVSPHTPGYDSRTFECPTCRHEETMIVKYK